MDLNDLCPDSLSQHFPTNQRASQGTNIYIFIFNFISSEKTICFSEMQAELEIRMDGGETEEEERALICDDFLPL